MKAAHILYLSYTGMTEPLGRSQVLAYLRGLAATGRYKFTIVSFENPSFFEKEKQQIARICEEAGIEWHPIPYFNRPPALSIFRRIRAIRTKVAQLQRQTAFDLVHCRSYRAALVGLWMKKKFGTKFLFDMRGFWADERVDGGLWKLNNPVYRSLYNWFKKKEKELLAKAAHSISLTENGKQEIETWKVNGKGVPVSVIPCCVDTELFDPEKVRLDTSAVREKLGIGQDQFVLTYLGSLGTWYLLDEMLHFFKLLLRKKPDAVFLFITNESAHMIMEHARKAGISEDRLMIRSAGRNEVASFLSVSNYSIFFIKQAYSKKASSPVKQGEIMAMGIPVICNDGVGDTGEIVRRHKAGLVISEFNEQSYQAVIDQLDHADFNAGEIRKGAMEVYSLQSGIESYRIVYQQILGTNSRELPQEAGTIQNQV